MSHVPRPPETGLLGGGCEDAAAGSPVELGVPPLGCAAPPGGLWGPPGAAEEGRLGGTAGLEGRASEVAGLAACCACSACCARTSCTAFEAVSLKPSKYVRKP